MAVTDAGEGHMIRCHLKDGHEGWHKDTRERIVWTIREPK